MMEIAKKKAVNSEQLSLFSKIDDLIQEELVRANEEHGKFASMHEGISVLLEEIEEAEFVLKSIKKLYAEAWGGVKADDYVGQFGKISALYLKALYLAAESIQVSAMAEKYYKYLKQHNPQVGIMEGQIGVDEATQEK
jgi:hypothetical protein